MAKKKQATTKQVADNTQKLVTKEEASKLADAHLLPDEFRYEPGVDLKGQKYIIDRCNPTYVTEDGNVFHSANEGEANSHARDKKLKVFQVNYPTK